MAALSKSLDTSVEFFCFWSSKFLSVMETGSNTGTQKIAVYRQMKKAAKAKSHITIRETKKKDSEEEEEEIWQRFEEVYLARLYQMQGTSCKWQHPGQPAWWFHPQKQTKLRGARRRCQGCREVRSSWLSCEGSIPKHCQGGARAGHGEWAEPGRWESIVWSEICIIRVESGYFYID